MAPTVSKYPQFSLLRSDSGVIWPHQARKSVPNPSEFILYDPFGVDNIAMTFGNNIYQDVGVQVAPTVPKYPQFSHLRSDSGVTWPHQARKTLPNPSEYIIYHPL